MYCDICGNLMDLDENEVSMHLTDDGEYDYQQDSDHVALSLVNA
jgi:hypothetical protein